MAGYTPLFSSIVTSSIWNEESATRIVWITMLALADSQGRVEGAIPGLAHVARVSLPDCEKALQRLLGPDLYSRTADYEGRRIHPIDGGWQIYNFAKFRQKAKSRSEYMRQYRESRKKKNPPHPLKEETNNKQQTITNKVTHSNTSVTGVTVTDFPLPPDLQTWQDIAFTVGLTVGEAQNSYDNFSANNWTRGNGVKIESWKQIPGLLKYWRNNRQNFAPKNKPTESAYDQMEELKRRGEL